MMKVHTYFYKKKIWKKEINHYFHCNKILNKNFFLASIQCRNLRVKDKTGTMISICSASEQITLHESGKNEWKLKLCWIVET